MENVHGNLFLETAIATDPRQRKISLPITSNQDLKKSAFKKTFSKTEDDLSTIAKPIEEENNYEDGLPIDCVENRRFSSISSIAKVEMNSEQEMETFTDENKHQSLKHKVSNPSFNGLAEGYQSVILSMKEMSGTLTLKEATNYAGFGSFQIILLLCLLCFHMTDAMEMLLLSVLSAPLNCQWHLESWQLALITTALFLGMAIAAPIWGKLADSFGRKPMLIVSTVFIAYFGLLSSLSPSSVWFTVLRCFVGMAIPGAYLAFVILSEFLPIKYKGMVLLIYSLSWPLGGISETLMTAFVLPTLGWRYLVGFTSIPVWLCLILIKFIPESPEYSMVSGKIDEVETTIKRMITSNKKDIPVDFKIVKEPKVKTGNFLDLFRDLHQGRVTLQLWFLGFGLAFLYYGVVLLLSESIRKNYQSCDLKIISDKEPNCPCKVYDWKHYTGLIVGACGEFGGFGLNILLLEVLGRTKMLILETSCLSIFIFLLYTCTSSQVRDFFQFMIRAFSLGANAVSNIYVTEIYSPEVRALAYGFYQTSYRVGAMTTPYLAQVLTDYSFKAAFTVYGILAILLAISIMFLPETKTGILWIKLKEKRNLAKSQK